MNNNKKRCCVDCNDELTIKCPSQQRCLKCNSEYENKRLAIAILRSYDPNHKVVYCTKCNEIPARKELDCKEYQLCYKCEEDYSIEFKCYNCEICIATRKYLEETDDIFKLVYCDQEYSNYVEYWQCKKCNRCIAIQASFNHSIEGNMFYEKARKIHLKYGCFIDTDEHSIIWL